MTASHQVILLLGSNIQPEKNLELGLELLRHYVSMVRCSSTWQSPSVGSSGPDYLNMAVLIKTDLEAAGLKEKILRPLEAQLGRVRSTDKNAPRKIDFDIILYDDQLLDPTLWRYAHRAVPVAEILPGLQSDQGEMLRDVAQRLVETTRIQRKPGVPGRVD